MALTIDNLEIRRSEWTNDKYGTRLTELKTKSEYFLTIRVQART